MTQQEQILKYIDEHGSITPMEAFRKLGITKLATVVSYARRKKGVPFVINKETTVNRYGHTVTYARYSLKEDANGI